MGLKQIGIKTKSLAVVAAAFALGLAGCSGPDVVNALVADTGYQVVKDVSYGDGSRRTMDLYVPSGAKDGAPTIIFFYGGSWKDGAKADYKFVGEALASRGYQVVVPDYRLYPEVRYPAFLEDSAAAVAFVLRDMGQHGAEPGPVYLAGHSAGAYNAVMMALDDRWLGAHDLRPCAAIAGVAGLAGPYDFLPLKSASLKAIFGPKSKRARTQPINYVSESSPPMLLASGLDDSTVSSRNSRRLAAAVRKQGGVVETKFYDDIGHIWLVAALAGPFRHIAPMLDDMDAFFKSHSKAGSCND